MLVRLFPHTPQFLIAWSVFLACGLVAYLTQAVRSSEKFGLRALVDRCIPFDVRTNASFHADLKIYFIDSFTALSLAVPGIFVTGMLSLLVRRLLTLGHISQQPVELSPFTAASCAMIMFLLAELSDYIAHFLEHKVPELWELHKLHHAVQILNPFTARRLHPVSILYNGLLRGVISGVPVGLLMHLFGITLAETLALSLAASKIFSMASLNPLKHSHHPVGFGPFDRLLISPHMHQIHHSRVDAHIDKNFGTNLSIFDWLFGTAYKPSPGELPDCGIAHHSTADVEHYFSLRGAYVQPMIDCCAVFLKRTRSRLDPPAASGPKFQANLQDMARHDFGQGQTGGPP